MTKFQLLVVVASASTFLAGCYFPAAWKDFRDRFLELKKGW